MTHVCKSSWQLDYPGYVRICGTFFADGRDLSVVSPDVFHFHNKQFLTIPNSESFSDFPQKKTLTRINFETISNLLWFLLKFLLESNWL